MQYTSELLMSNVSENYRSDESFEEHFVLKLILVSTKVLKLILVSTKGVETVSAKLHELNLTNNLFKLKLAKIQSNVSFN